MSYRIFLVEDESNLNQVLTSYLQQEGWHIRSFQNGQAAKDTIGDKPHLWILDIMLPQIDGYQLIRDIKAHSNDTPVIFISARDAELDRVIGLELGSDDYLPKPFLPRELVIRTRKLLQRIYGEQAAAAPKSVLLLPPYEINETARTAMLGATAIDLTSKEFDLLLLFAKNQGQAFSREQILHAAWGSDYFGTDRVVDDLVRRLRKKMPELRLETIYGYGYRMLRP